MRESQLSKLSSELRRKIAKPPLPVYRPTFSQALSALAGPTPVPREVCSSWFPALAARRVAAVACGGQHILVLLAGD